ncbi:MAG: hypothetical protein GWP08_07895 [Nitrospiraceae bacterium]|nr:hypothetical protein [Nitrospiraceae bacterium]
MARGTIYDPERVIRRDPRSGLRIIQLTHHPSISTNMYFEMCSFTTDEQHVIVRSQRGAGRDDPWDLMRIKTDGAELVQMTEDNAIGGIVVAPVSGCVVYQSGPELRKVNIHSLEEEIVAETPGLGSDMTGSLASIDAAGKTYFGTCRMGENQAAVFRADIASGQVDVLFEGRRQHHVHANPAGTVVYFGEWLENGPVPYLVNADGSNLRPYPFTRFAHHTWFGGAGAMQGCLLPPGHALVTYTEGDEAPKVITEGRYYWHSSATPDAQWIVADTNWPREGIYLVHVPTRTVAFVCDPQSSCSHPQWTHPHPSISPQLRYVLFNSDATGIGQVYLAELTDEFVQQAAQGYACKAELR